VDPFEIGDIDSGAAAKRGTMLFAAPRAMAVQQPQQRPSDFVFDAAAKAADGMVVRLGG